MIAAAVLALLTADPMVGLKRDAVMEFARCVKRRAPDRVAELLATEPGSADEHRRVGVIAGAYGACVGNKRMLSFQTLLLRGQLAEIAFQDDAAVGERARKLAAGSVVIPDAMAIEKSVSSIPATNRDQAYADRFRTAYARCVTVANPTAIASLIPTKPASVEERSALVTAKDTLMACMPQGITYHVKSAELRPYLMSELYYLAVAGVRAGA